MTEISAETRVKLYECIIRRYKEIISAKESVSIADLRQRISPYSDFVRTLRDKLIHDLQPYDYRKHFFSAAQRMIGYIKGMQTIELAFTFWWTFEEMDLIKAAPRMDKALFLAALLRSLESKDVKVLVTRAQKPYVYLIWEGERYLVDPESGSLLRGEDTDSAFKTDPVAYAFNDLFFESYEQE
jgi:hypothetical protein